MFYKLPIDYVRNEKVYLQQKNLQEDIYKYNHISLQMCAHIKSYILTASLLIIVTHWWRGYSLGCFMGQVVIPAQGTLFSNVKDWISGLGNNVHEFKKRFAKREKARLKGYLLSGSHGLPSSSWRRCFIQKTFPHNALPVLFIEAKWREPNGGETQIEWPGHSGREDQKWRSIRVFDILYMTIPFLEEWQPYLS